MSDQFRTFQTVRRYEEALSRHAQWIRWVRAILCPCITRTRQPDPNCSLCYGRGTIYRNPGIQSILQEQVRVGVGGKLYPAHTPVTGTPRITLRGLNLGLGTQPVDGSYIQLSEPYPAAYEPVMANYEFLPVVSVTAEDSDIVAESTLRVVAPRFSEKGHDFEGSIDAITRVYNATKSETYTVSAFAKEYIYLTDMGTWASGDVLEVDYTYLTPFAFLLSQVSMKMRYEQAYVLDNADAVLVTPYWAKISSNDLFTTLAAEQYAEAVIDPNAFAGNDVIRDYYDLSRLLEVVDSSGTFYTVGSDVELFGRNELKWNVTKPTLSYTVTFLYHPTYVALQSMPTLRTSENKAFVNKVSVRLYDKLDDRLY